MSAIESQIVGYLGQESRAGFNYMTPTFEAVGGGNLSAQDIQMPAEATTGSGNIQVLDEEGLSHMVYGWYPKTSITSKFFSDKEQKNQIVCPEGKNGMWLHSNTERVGGRPVTWYDVLDKTFAPADAVQVYTEEDKVVVTTSGQVPGQTVTLTSIAGFNYVGNPFPVAIAPIDIQMPTEATTGSGNIQVLDAEGLSHMVYGWYPKTSITSKFFSDKEQKNQIVCPDNRDGMWLHSNTERVGGRPVTWYDVLEGEIKPGAAVQVYTEVDKTELTIHCPYSL